MKSSKTPRAKPNGNQVRVDERLKISRHGGARPGAGRKPGSSNKPTNDLYEPCCAALAAALDGAVPFEFICAMYVLGAPLDASREALGMSQSSFSEKYGPALMHFIERQRLGRAAQDAA